jgi:multisubunit Na+/H+ antiporter MnhB subunit
VNNRESTPRSLELGIGGATVLLSTAAHLLGSPDLGVVSLVIGGISFGMCVKSR